MGRAEGIEIEEIVLHPFGGLARLRNEPENPRAEFRIAIAGPAASFLFAAISFVLMLPAMTFGLSRRRAACCCCFAPATCCSQSSICFRVIRWMAAACFARSSGVALATSKKRRASRESAAC